ncbi:MAG: amidase [Halomonadaceae bacterium]|nr:MAG: amidase [Halomonadaceae bacterium]
MTQWHYNSARSTAAALASGELSSAHLTQTLLDRIKALNGPLNAVVAIADDAMDQARAADQALADGRSLGPLHGLPITIKDVWEVTGMACTAGAPALKDYRPKRHADTIQRLVDAGAIIMGKTNVPLYASDTQTYNKVYGISHNPYDTSRTPGGSSGGGAAALAAGFTHLELGSDVGGSIRTPAHFCGIYGHKPSRGIVSLRGHIPGPVGTLSQPDLAVGGPMARSADDLAFLLEIIAAAPTHEGPHWQVVLPPCRLTALSQVRVATRFSDPLTPIEDELGEQYQTLAGALEAAGATVSHCQSPLINHEGILPLYYNLLGTLLGSGFKAKQRRQMRWVERSMKIFGRWIKATHGIDQYAAGVNQSFLQWVSHHEQREQLRAAVVRKVFADADVLLTPVAPTTAIPHDHSMPMFKRHISVNGNPRPYTDKMNWIALATVLGLPATSAPIGKDRHGLPINVQIIGAPGMDLTTIGVAQLMEQAGLSRFTAPEGF